MRADSPESNDDRAIVYVVDDDDGLREATCFNLKVAGYRVVGFASGEAFLATADLHGGGCLVLDVNMPRMGGMELQQRLNEVGSNIAVVMVTGYGDVPTAVTAVRAGAVDFIEKPYLSEVLFAAIDRALAGERKTVSSPQSEKATAAIVSLTPRERDVLQGLVSGKANKAIASELGLSPRTVEMHRANMMDKLGVRSLSEALRIAYDAGFAQDRRRTTNLPRIGGQRATDRRQDRD